MGYRAVALSQVEGSGAESIGRDVAQQLGFGYLNEAIVAQVASDRGVDRAIISDAEQRKAFFSRLAEMALRAAPEMSSPPPLRAFNEPMPLWDIRDAVRDAADRGNAALVAHAACYARAGFRRAPRLGHRSAVDEGVPAGFRARPQRQGSRQVGAPVGRGASQLPQAGLRHR